MGVSRFQAKLPAAVCCVDTDGLTAVFDAGVADATTPGACCAQQDTATERKNTVARLTIKVICRKEGVQSPEVKAVSVKKGFGEIERCQRSQAANCTSVPLQITGWL
jgi:hypothetical protein